ncbi:MAG TPA: SpoIID/LytB domain-containing protein [Actinomycetota bacterium]|nr:SpoIID/LytB domain-containing protein [Actinomycetota bacterium]
MRRTLLLTVLVLVLAGAVPAGAGPNRSSRGPSEFRMFGGGFGHGLGLSQWGAFGLATKGWGSTKILKHFYSGTRVVTKVGPNQLRIGLVQDADAVRLEAEAGTVEIRLGDPRGDVVASIPLGETWRVRAAAGAYSIVDSGGTTVGTVGGPDEPIFAVYAPTQSRVRVPEAGHTYNRGSIEFGLYACDAGPCTMRLVLTVDPQEYLYGLGEVPSSWPMSAMKAQAIAARTYAFTKAATSQHRPECDCALYATSFDQVYAGWDKEGGADGERWVAAVRQTNRQVVVKAGQTIQAFYMSSSGGYTENNENVWGGEPISYLRGVCDPGDYTSSNPNATWRETFSSSQLTQGLGLRIGTVTGFTDIARGVSGRIMSVTVEGANGQASISGSDLRSALGLPDDRLWINADRRVIGAIRAKYDAQGCSPGLPISRQVSVAGGARQTFEEGTIFESTATGAHYLRGPVLDRYLSKGGPRGSLGFPIDDVRRLDNGNWRGRFEGGVIVCQADGSPCRID